MNIHLVTEIPGPYRNPHFAELERQFNSKGHQLIVHFMSETDDIRPASWFIKNEIKYTHQFHETHTLKIGRRKIYWNPSIIREIRKSKPDIVITGGLWSSLTCLFLIIFWPKCRLIAWTELNENVLGISNSLANQIRKWLLMKPRALAIPGKSSENYLQKIMKMDLTRINTIPFPNLIDESIFNPNESRTRLNELNHHLHESTRIALWPARLEFEKGIEDFIPLLSKDFLDGWKIIIIGEGSRKKAIIQLIEMHSLNKFIEIRPYVKTSVMANYYSQADLLLLPSLRDPNPLSVIESLRMGLPLLLSDAVGNHYEALSNKNGWLLHNHDSSTQKIGILKDVFSTSKAELRAMGVRSREVYHDNWELSHACERTVASILALTT